MNDAYDYKKYAILFVDDEKMALDVFVESFAKKFRILTASSAEEGWALFSAHQNEIAMVVSDQRMPNTLGTELLAKVKQTHPRVLRILATAFSDLQAAVDGINNGAIYKYVTKPWHQETMEMTFMRGIEFFMLQKERDQLARERFSTIHRLMVTERVISFGLIAAGLQQHLRHILLAVQTFISTAAEKLKEDEVDLDNMHDPNFWRALRNHAEFQAKRITDFLGDIHALSLPSDFNYSDQVDLHEMVGEVLKETAKECVVRNIQYENNIPKDLPPLVVDLKKFRRIFELFMKSEQLSLPAGSFIEFKAEPIEKGGHAKAWVRITMEDNGPALSKESLRAVFDPFHQPKTDAAKNYGFYLMVCFFLVYHHGGTLFAESHSDIGNIFTMEFPMKPQAMSQYDISQEFMGQVLLNDALWERLLREM